MKLPRPRVLQALLLVLSISMMVAYLPKLQAQSAAGTPAAQTTVPQWQIDAGGKMAFEVVSVIQDLATPNLQTTGSNVPLDPMDDFTSTGGLFYARNTPLRNYLVFAYKLNEDQIRSVASQLPKWAEITRYDIQARGPGNPTKDQMRLMMQALLADRFKLAIHYETKEIRMFALVLDKPGKLGPQLRLHTDDQPCSYMPVSPRAVNGNAPQFSMSVEGGFPQSCGVIARLQPSTSGHLRIGARNMSLTMFAGIMSEGLTGISRPVLDKTGLAGKVDFVIEFTPQYLLDGPPPPGTDFQPDPNGPTFMEGLKDQLGLTLDSQTGPVDVLVIDHIEEPSPN
jgi:uncharacterized protein (TIGR03435 family)